MQVYNIYLQVYDICRCTCSYVIYNKIINQNFKRYSFLSIYIKECQDFFKIFSYMSPYIYLRFQTWDSRVYFTKLFKSELNENLTHFSYTCLIEFCSDGDNDIKVLNSAFIFVKGLRKAHFAYILYKMRSKLHIIRNSWTLICVSGVYWLEKKTYSSNNR